jgi:hypothetical protein
MRIRLFYTVVVAIALTAASCSSSSADSASVVDGSTSTWPANTELAVVEGERYRQPVDASRAGTVDIYYSAETPRWLMKMWGLPSGL